MTVDIEILNLVAGTLIPLLVGLVTKEVASSRLKGLTNTLMSVVSGLVAAAIANSGEFVFDAATTSSVVNTFLISIGTYYGIWKSTGVAKAVQSKTSTFGLNDSDKESV